MTLLEEYRIWRKILGPQVPRTAILEHIKDYPPLKQAIILTAVYAKEDSSAMVRELLNWSSRGTLKDWLFKNEEFYERFKNWVKKKEVAEVLRDTIELEILQKESKEQ